MLTLWQCRATQDGSGLLDVVEFVQCLEKAIAVGAFCLDQLQACLPPFLRVVSLGLHVLALLTRLLTHDPSSILFYLPLLAHRRAAPRRPGGGGAVQAAAAALHRERRAQHHHDAHLYVHTHA